MFNSLIINVIQARGLKLKNKALDIYVLLNTSGKSKWKSKVSTNAVKSEDGKCVWNERCEFDLSETDIEICISVNYKTVFGTTETLGGKTFVIEQMKRNQPPTWVSLTRRNSSKERGEIQLEYQLNNKLNSSVSNTLLNKIEKEKALDKFKHKISNIVQSKKALKDNDSAVSVFLSQKSSFSSNASALAFSLPPSNLQKNDILFTSNENVLSKNDKQEKTNLPATNHQTTNASSNINIKNDLALNNTFINEKRNSLQSEKLAKDSFPILNNVNTQSSKNITKKMRYHAEKIYNFYAKKPNFDGTDEIMNNQTFNFVQKIDKKLNSVVNKSIDSRPCSIRSSSGFASLSSNNIETLNENTSTEHLFNIIKHLRHELLIKNARIQDLEQYTDKLLEKIIIYNPEVLEIPPKFLLK